MTLTLAPRSSHEQSRLRRAPTWPLRVRSLILPHRSVSDSNCYVLVSPGWLPECIRRSFLLFCSVLLVPSSPLCSSPLFTALYLSSPDALTSFFPRLLPYPPCFPHVFDCSFVPCSFFYAESVERPSPTTGVNAFGNFVRITITSIPYSILSFGPIAPAFCTSFASDFPFLFFALLYDTPISPSGIWAFHGVISMASTSLRNSFDPKQIRIVGSSNRNKAKDSSRRCHEHAKMLLRTYGMIQGYLASLFQLSGRPCPFFSSRRDGYVRCFASLSFFGSFALPCAHIPDHGRGYKFGSRVNSWRGPRYPKCWRIRCFRALRQQPIPPVAEKCRPRNQFHTQIPYLRTRRNRRFELIVDEPFSWPPPIPFFLSFLSLIRVSYLLPSKGMLIFTKITQNWFFITQWILRTCDQNRNKGGFENLDKVAMFRIVS